MTVSPHPLKTAIVYPDSDGAPMAESDPARDYLVYGVEALKLYFQQREDVYVSGNLFIYYQQGVPSAVIAPDVFVIFGVGNHPRMSYKAWQENNKLPDFVLEITSATTQAQDEQDKPIKYARLGVKEYFQYDPSGDYLNPRLKGVRLLEGKYEPIETKIPVYGNFCLYSSVLELDLLLIDGKLRFYNPKADIILPSYQEIAQEKQQAEQARQQAEQARQQAEQARKDAIPRLQSLGLSGQQIAAALNLSLEEVREINS